MRLEIDHLVVCVEKLEYDVPVFEETRGVVSVPGGKHAGHGTANRLVPLGDSYIELVAVVDPSEARRSGFGRWVSARADSEGADALSIRTDDLDAVCDRLDLEPIGMSRQSGDGSLLSWRIAGLERTVSDNLPFFIQWEMDPRLHPGRIAVTHPGGDLRLDQVTLSGDPGQIEEWIDGVEGVDVVEGEPGVVFSLS